MITIATGVTMETIKIWRCPQCHCGYSTEGFCVSRDKIDNETCGKAELLTARIEEPAVDVKPEPYVFGQDVEVFDGEWFPSVYIKPAEDYHGQSRLHWVISKSGEPIRALFGDIRLPLRGRMVFGQPVFVGARNLARIFAGKFNEDGDLVVLKSPQFGTHDSFSKWRLPTIKELAFIGHANGCDNGGNPWLTSDG
jgi:hypothetical protein